MFPCMKIMNFILLTALFAVAERGLAAPLTIDFQASTIDVAVKSTLHSFTGHLETYTAEVDTVISTNNLPKSAEVNFDFSDLKTGNTNRDADMLKWVQHDKYPKARFHLTGWEQNGTTNLAVGDLTIHGVTATVKMPTKVTQTPTGWEITGQADFDYRTFDLPKIRKALLLTVDPHLRVMFHLVGRTADGK